MIAKFAFFAGLFQTAFGVDDYVKNLVKVCMSESGISFDISELDQPISKKELEEMFKHIQDTYPQITIITMGECEFEELSPDLFSKHNFFQKY